MAWRPEAAAYGTVSSSNDGTGARGRPGRAGPLTTAGRGPPPTRRGVGVRRQLRVVSTPISSCSRPPWATIVQR